MTGAGRPVILPENLIQERPGRGLVGSKAGPREPGKVEAGACAGVEWTPELQAEIPPSGE